jgi:hypothetical protein
MPAFVTKPVGFAEDELRECFEYRPFYVTHELKTHPLFQIDALLDAGDRLPPSLIECNAGSVPISLPEGKSAGHGLTPRQIVALMPDEKVWLGLKKIDLLPEYREVIETLLSSVRSGTAASYPGMRNLEGYVFISSPGTIVPYHMDPEHNFLLQIRGDKSMYLLDRDDPDVLAEGDIERYYTSTTRRMVFDDSMHQRAKRWYLDPGRGMHVPVNFPHYVETGNDISVSLSTTFDTSRQQARARVYKVNYYLRKLGIKPARYGSSAWSDRLKSAAGMLYQKATGN